MPGIPLVARETTNSLCNCSSRSIDKMCRQDARFNLSPEEEAAAEETLSIYCKPVELYNILQRRAIRKPLYLQRCLGYKIQAKHKKRIQLILSLLPSVNHGLKIQSLLPLYIMLARPAPNFSIAEQSVRYQFRRCFIINTCHDGEGRSRVQAKFILPEYNKLSAEIKSGSLAILFISFDEPVGDHMDFESFQTKGGNCRLGKIPMELLHLSWEESPNLTLRERSETILTVDLHLSVLKTSCIDGDRYLSFQATPFGTTLAHLQQLKVIFHAEEVGAKDRSPYDSYTYTDVPSSSLPHLTRLRTGNVVFNYRYYNNRLQRTEVTEDFSCPFCLIKCASFKGLRLHLSSLHDLFSFEFWATEDYQAVNVSVRTDTRRSEIVSDGIDPKQQTFLFCSKPQKRRNTASLFPSAKHVHPLVFESDFPMTTTDWINECPERDAPSPDTTRVVTTASSADLGCIIPFSGSNTATLTLLQFSKTRKLSTERDPRNRSLLQKRQFFHSHRAQPMTLEQVMSDQDSEDEVDDDVADLEDRRMLDDFVDVSNDEKQMMHLWNSFVRKQRVLADGHTPWSCEAFTELHAFDLVQSHALLWCWRMFMVKLWNHGLLDQLTMNKCSTIINEQRQNQSVIIHSLKAASDVESPPVRFGSMMNSLLSPTHLTLPQHNRESADNPTVIDNSLIPVVK